MAEHEIKFVFPARCGQQLINWLGRRCGEDGKHPRGIVSSVYYDTLDWNFLHEKINSDYLKTKYRLRWYQDCDSLEYSESCYFEKKEKIGSTRRKSRIEIPLDDAVKRARYLNVPFLMELPMRLFSQELKPIRAILPVFQISYTRHRFIDTLSGARLAVDSAIAVPRVNPAMVKQCHSRPLSHGVFECKSENMELPAWLHGATLFGCRKAAFSKYSNCYEHITGLPV